MSSILIKDKKMPKCCVACWAAEICRHYDRFSNYERPEHCPLVEVPEPHGRLIDAEVVNSALKKRLLAVDTAPTIIEAEGQGHGCGKSEEEKE